MQDKVFTPFILLQKEGKGRLLARAIRCLIFEFSRISPAICAAEITFEKIEDLTSITTTTPQKWLALFSCARAGSLCCLYMQVGYQEPCLVRSKLDMQAQRRWLRLPFLPCHPRHLKGPLCGPPSLASSYLDFWAPVQGSTPTTIPSVRGRMS
jgi:hypothetical protein